MVCKGSDNHFMKFADSEFETIVLKNWVKWSAKLKENA